MILASLCCLVAFAEKQSPTRAQRTPGTLFAAMDIPIPVPQSRIPLSKSPATTASPTALAKSG